MLQVVPPDTGLYWGVTLTFSALCRHHFYASREYKCFREYLYQECLYLHPFCTYSFHTETHIRMHTHTYTHTHTYAHYPTRCLLCPWSVMSTIWPIIVLALHPAEVIWSSQFILSERERRAYPKHNQLWRCSDECCISTTHNIHIHTQRSHYPITQTVLSFTHKHLWIITKNLTEDRACLRDPDFTTTSICQQTISIILWIASMTQPSTMPHVPSAPLRYWPKPLYTLCRLEVCKSLRT